MCVLEILEFHCYRIFLNGYINKLFHFKPKAKPNLHTYAHFKGCGKRKIMELDEKKKGKEKPD